MKFIVLSPPVHQPSEPPAGAYLLTSALTARGIDAGFLDLSLEFFHYALEHSAINTEPAVRYMKSPPAGLYDRHGHASNSGVIMSALRRYGEGFPGWSLTPMDCAPPRGLHRPLEMPLEETPFSRFFEAVLEPVLDRFPEAEVLVSVAYLSQLPASLELGRFLEKRRRRALFGGSLFESLSRTGTGLKLLGEALPRISTGDGSELFPAGEPGSALDRLDYPPIISERCYLAPRPVLPLAFTTGCIWNRCLFCPDRTKPMNRVPISTIQRMIGNAAPGTMVHFIDSTIPVDGLLEVLPSLRDKEAGFFGFARASSVFDGTGLLEELAGGGCAMLQWGLESGSREILRRYRKGIVPETAARIIRESCECGIRNYVYLLFGLPGETPSDRDATLELVRSAEKGIDFLNTSVFNLPLNSELAERHEEFGMSLSAYEGGEEVIRLYSPFTCDDGNPRADARIFLRNRFNRDPAVAGIGAYTPKWFRATHMAFMERRGEGKGAAQREDPSR